jgi:hypothetical protein
MVAFLDFLFAPKTVFSSIFCEWVLPAMARHSFGVAAKPRKILSTRSLNFSVLTLPRSRNAPNVEPHALASPHRATALSASLAQKVFWFMTL